VGNACDACGLPFHRDCLARAGHCPECACAKPPLPFRVTAGTAGTSPAQVMLVAAIMLVAVNSFAWLRWTSLDTNRVPHAPKPIVRALTSPWSGHIHGNDPDVDTVLPLTQEGRMLSGTLQWSSPRSGSNTRRVTGFVDVAQHTVLLKDVDIPVVRNQTNWKFCTIDYYLLRISLDYSSLEGTYWSAACGDAATVKLSRLN
jgi:hypothetical protein